MRHITNDQIAAVQKGLLTGVSDRQIARNAGVARGTVAAIRQGREKHFVRISERREKLDGLPDPDGGFHWCRGCGHLVLMPCLACRLIREQPSLEVIRQVERQRPRSRRIAMDAIEVEMF